jgi:hypothetical protein
MISLIGMLTGMDAATFCQEFGQAVMWLSCAFVGWVASSLLLTYLGCKKDSKTTKAKVSSEAFRKEVALHANKTCTSVAARHFGLSETEVQQYCSQFEGKQSSVNNMADTEAAEETSSAPEAPLFTAPSVHPGHVLLEHYDVFNPREGAWSGPLEIQSEETRPSTSKYVPIPLSKFKEVKAEEFFEGPDTISLWLVPEGHVYDHCSHRWVKDTTSI